MELNQMTIMIDGVAHNLNDNHVFKRTINVPRSNAAEHNIARWDWIGKKGKTFKEINKANSFYRQNVKRTTYLGNQSPIIKDLEYDLKNGWIKKVD
jgi:hypothetical protein